MFRRFFIMVLMSAAVDVTHAASPGQVAVSGSDAGDQLVEIVVTAEKHEESSQRTAISMSVYSGDELRAESVNTIQSLTRIDPSINFSTSTGDAYIAVRGIASADFTEIGDPAVAISRDGFFTNRDYTLFSSMYDVARIEVLKGPQGTLYGRNTAGGVINIISQRPTDQFGGYGQIDVGNYHALNLEGAINLPINDTLQLRASGASIYHAGYRSVTSVNPSFTTLPNADDADERSARVQVAFQPWAGFKGLVSVQKDVSTGAGDAPLNAEFGTGGPPGITIPGTTPAVPYGQAGGWTQSEPTNVEMDDTRYRWEFSQELPAKLLLTYLGGYDTISYSHALDGTAPATTNSPMQFLVSEHPRTQNDELRLSNTPDSRLFWQVGGFYFREINKLTSGYFDNGGPFAGLNLIHFDYHVDTTSKAGFGQLEFKFNDEWKASAGIRYTQDHKLRSGQSELDLTAASGGFLSLPAPGCYFGPNTSACSHLIQVASGYGDITNSRATYHVGVDWSPSQENLVYAKYDTGYKSGGFNSNGSAAAVDYGPETVGSFEIGTKNRLFGNRLEANLSLFDMRYKGYQASQFTQIIAGSSSGVFNAGTATIYGAEGELAWVIRPQTRFNLAASYLHATFSDGCASDASVTYTASAPNCGSPLQGRYLPNAPSLSANTGIEQGILDASGGRWSVELQGKYQSRFYFDIFNHPDLTQRSYAIGDVSFSYAPVKTNWSVQAYVHNFADSAVIGNATRNSLILANNYEFQPPRTYGMKFNARF